MTMMKKTAEKLVFPDSKARIKKLGDIARKQKDKENTGSTTNSGSTKKAIKKVRKLTDHMDLSCEIYFNIILENEKELKLKLKELQAEYDGLRKLADRACFDDMHKHYVDRINELEAEVKHLQKVNYKHENDKTDIRIALNNVRDKLGYPK